MNPQKSPFICKCGAKSQNGYCINPNHKDILDNQKSPSLNSICDTCKKRIITIQVCYDCVQERDTKLRNQTIAQMKEDILKIIDKFKNKPKIKEYPQYWECLNCYVKHETEMGAYNCECLFNPLLEKIEEEIKNYSQGTKEKGDDKIEMETKLTLINTNLRRYTFESFKIKEWVESRSKGKCLNLFAGKTKLKLNEFRVDKDKAMKADYYGDALDFVKKTKLKFDTIILDPPYSYRKSMEMYKGNMSSRFKQIADNLKRILKKDGIVISFGYHSSFMGKVRNFNLMELCIFAHGGSQHCTIGIIEKEKRQ